MWLIHYNNKKKVISKISHEIIYIDFIKLRKIIISYLITNIRDKILTSLGIKLCNKISIK